MLPLLMSQACGRAGGPPVGEPMSPDSASSGRPLGSVVDAHDAPTECPRADCSGCELGFAERPCLFPSPTLADVAPLEQIVIVAEARDLLYENGVHARVRMPDADIPVFVVNDVAVKKARTCLDCAFAGAPPLVQPDESNGPEAVRGFEARDVLPEFRTPNGMIDLPRVWNEMVNAFPEVCGRELNSSTLAGRRVETHEFQIPTPRTGLVFKGRFVMSLTPSQEIDSRSGSLSVEGVFGWRRASESGWHRVTSTEVARPTTAGHPTTRSGSADDALGECATRLASRVLDVP